MKIIISIISWIGIIYFVIFSITVRAEDIVPKARTIDSEITRLALVYKVPEKIVRAIISCEGSLGGELINDNIDKDGNVWSKDYGPFQINNYYHEKDMRKAGLDIRDKFDSLEYGFILISKSGFLPWKASFSCWSKQIA